jgi:hypothetical protein
MLNVTNATRIAELERALENVVEYLKKLPIHPMHNAAINAAEHKLRPPYAGSLLNRQPRVQHAVLCPQWHVDARCPGDAA